MTTTWLTRAQIDQAVEAISAADLIDVIGDGDSIKGTRMMMALFDAAAEREGLSNGSGPASQHVSLKDFQYLASAIGEAVNVTAPLSGKPKR